VVDRDLILTNINTQDQITVTDFDDSNTTMDEIRFASGVVWRPPVIISVGGGFDVSLNVAEKSTAVTTIEVVDDDAVTISISDSNPDAALFELNPTTGAISFKTAPDFESPSDFNKDNVYEFVVEVTDTLGFKNYQRFYVSVTDVNEAPVISSNGGGNSASVSVAENQTAVLTANVDKTTATWSISGGADKALFQIDATTGALSFKSAPDFDAAKDNGKNNIYDVTIKATDSGGLSDTQAIAVKVTNVNDAPVISSKGTGTIVAVMAENGKAVTTAKAADPEKTAITWSISAGADKALFQIDAKTGVVSFKSAPDFEVPKDSDKDNIYDVMVKATDATGLSDTEWLAVVVTNVNDAPVISSNGGGSTAAVNAAENAKAVTSVRGADPEKTVITWSISGGADKALFKIDAKTGVVSFKSAPDFEAPTDIGKNNVYDVTIKVTDATGLSDTQALAVTVANVNETPVITSNDGGTKAAVTIAENTKTVTTAKATDPDKAAVTWSISGGADKALFQIDAKTGAVAFKSAPDFEAANDSGTNNVYDVTIKATDAGGLSDTQALAVTITNVNDAPVISSNGGGSTAAVNAVEIAKAVTTGKGADPEKTAITWSISGGADKALFQIDAKTGVVSFKSAPDFEAPTDIGKNNVYDVTIKVTDATGLSDTQALAVTVVNVNETPTITSNGGGTKATVTIAENGKAVTTAKAADPDKTAVTWSISGGADKALFQIDPKTGALTFKSAPDFEAANDSGANNVYDVTIKATDTGGLSDTQALAVTVANVNETPIITSNGGGTKAAVTISENTKTVTTAKATDPDKTAVSWSISGGADKALFQIDAKTGVVSFKSAPDFEAANDSGTNNVYDVTIKATDAGGLSDTQALAVTVANANETPVITSNGGGTKATVTIAENTKTVTTAKATDPDKTAVTWSISGGADKALFQIDPKTGVVSFKSAPDFEATNDSGTNNVYDVTIKATDTGGLSDTQALAVTVANVNETPVITSNGGGTKAAVTISENTKTVTTAKATDPDKTAVTWSISGGADKALFQIDAKTGVVSFKSAPDFEAATDSGTNNVYDVTIKATDEGGRSDTQAIAVTVANINETPVITSNGGGTNAVVNLAENKTAVLTAQAIDPEKSPLTWSISGGADKALFLIDEKTGALTLKSAPDFEIPTDIGKNNIYDVTIKATDVTGLSDTQALAITVNDVKGKTFTGAATVESFTGTLESDVMTGAAGNDILSGAGGKDSLTGGTGADKLTGGAGADTFIFLSVNDSTVDTKGRDTIFDFDGAGGDRIDLSKIDANSATALNDAFSFIGNSAFSKKAGELRYDKGLSDTYLYGDTNGDGTADFAIHFDDALAFSKGYFVL